MISTSAILPPFPAHSKGLTQLNPSITHVTDEQTKAKKGSGFVQCQRGGKEQSQGLNSSPCMDSPKLTQAWLSTFKVKPTILGSHFSFLLDKNLTQTLA